jgi:hypothetical protein
VCAPNQDALLHRLLIRLGVITGNPQ